MNTKQQVISVNRQTSTWIKMAVSSSNADNLPFPKDLLDSTLLSIFGGSPPRRPHLDLTEYRDANKDIWSTKSAQILLQTVKKYRAKFYTELEKAASTAEIRAACHTFCSSVERWLDNVICHARHAHGFPRRQRKATALEAKARSRNLTFRKYLDRLSSSPTQKNLYSLRNSLREIYYIVHIDRF